MDLVEIKVHQTSVEKRHPWETARFDFFIHKMSQYIDFSSSVTIMDVGCGDAYFIASLKRKYPNLNCIGVDINFTEEIKKTLKQTYDDVEISLYTTILDAKNEHLKVDLILLMDVIEHIEDDVAFLKMEILPVMTTDKCLTFITVPAYQALFTKHDVFLGHYRRYDNNLLLQNTSKSGLAHIELGYFFSTLIGLRLFEKALDKLNPTRNAEGIANWNGSDLMTNIVVSILRFDLKVSLALRKLKIKLPGLSNYIICKTN